VARIRTIKPEFVESESVGKLSREARLLFILLWTFVDDAGRARASSRLLTSRLYPYDDDAAPGMSFREAFSYPIDRETFPDIDPIEMAEGEMSEMHP
jgi:hypothetical protein